MIASFHFTEFHEMIREKNPIKRWFRDWMAQQIVHTVIGVAVDELMKSIETFNTNL